MPEIDDLKQQLAKLESRVRDNEASISHCLREHAGLASVVSCEQQTRRLLARLIEQIGTMMDAGGSHTADRILEIINLAHEASLPDQPNVGEPEAGSADSAQPLDLAGSIGPHRAKLDQFIVEYHAATGKALTLPAAVDLLLGLILDHVNLLESVLDFEAEGEE